MRRARNLVPAALLLVPLVLFGPPPRTARSGDPAPGGTRVTGAERDRAIRRGLAYLDANVFRLPDVQGTPKKPFVVAVTGLDYLLADAKGSKTDGHGAGLRKVRRFLATWLERVVARTADEAQLPDHPGHFSSDRVIQYTWPVALAGVFFGESYARGQAKGQARRMLGHVRRLLGEAQRPNGGWGHHKLRAGPAPAPAVPRGQPPGFPRGGGYPDTLVSASFVIGSSLGLVEAEAGKPLPEHLAKAVAYYRAAQLENGNLPYDPSQRAAGSDLTGVSRAAGTAFALWSLGVPLRDRQLRRSLDFVDANFDYLNEGHGSSTLNLMYGALLQRVRGTRAWKRFRKRYFRPILDLQREDGSFACICEGKAFASTNDTDPFGEKRATPPGATVKRVRKTAGDPSLLERFRKGTTGAYVTAIHTFILLLDRTQPKLLDRGRPRVPGGARATPVTPR